MRAAPGYKAEQQHTAAAWKAHTTDLPDAARRPAAYVDKEGQSRGGLLGHCLPADLAHHNLLHQVRSEALQLFDELGIPWHAGISGGPSNNLLSSQVQCANALTAMVSDPDRVIRAFAGAVDVGEPLEVEPGRHMTFEYIGPTDFFDESPGRPRIRGSHCTSIDAAFRHRAPDGAEELVLVEWKYTESYPRQDRTPGYVAKRQRRYTDAIQDPSGPIRGDLLAFEHLLDEPLYQLVRQQLLAHALEQADVADRVRVVLVVPPPNAAYSTSLQRPEHRALGSTVSEVWRRLLRRPDRFTTMDSEAFLTTEVTSREYVLRYSPDVVWDEPTLLGLLGVDDGDAVADALDWEGDVELLEDSVELRSGTRGTGLSYPFRLRALRELAAEMAG